MNQDHLNTLSMISVEKNMITRIKNFIEKVIENFVMQKIEEWNLYINK